MSFVASDLGFNHYYHNKNAWMTKSIFVLYFRAFNAKMKERRRKVLVLMDNAAVHDSELQLSNVQFVYLPPNTTSHFQPLDAGIIACFKKQYRYIGIVG